MYVSSSPLRDKAKEFAKEIVFLCREIKGTHREAVLTNQLLRSGTSIGANLHEAQYAHGTKDFISKLEIAQKECYETEYWLELLFETGYIPEAQYKPLQNTCGAIRRMLIASLNTAKANSSR
ncbi:MAG: four helix bundle protein [Ruminiclostridium sp.]|nr:four helix bundle protein [Ruminiclostridium sp.]